MDDIVLNIAEASTQASAPRRKVKGGRWTDRLAATKSHKRPASTVPVQRSAKRPKTTGDLVPTDTTPSTQPAPPLAAPRQVISSLFTSNPTLPKTLTRTTPATPATPTNAPLDGTTSFLDLGLDPLLVSHLQHKMHLSMPTAIQAVALPLMIASQGPSSTADFFLQSQTGSGKTLSFLLPIIQDLLPLSTLSHVTRAIGTLAIVIAPTRELAKQISDVLEELVQLRLRPYTDAPDHFSETNSSQLTRWLVSGLLTGGATRAHEKARLRKGLPILVSTPGRLLDHLQHTSAFDVGKCRWLVLDEADRLMDLGFADTIDGILKSLDGRRRLAIQSAHQGNLETAVYDWDWSRPRRTILCSATIREDVESLAGRALRDPILINAPSEAMAGADQSLQSRLPDSLSIPAQLEQKYIVVPLKLRLITLVALFRTLISKAGRDQHPAKIIVFLSCTDSVDFHWSLLGATTMGSSITDATEESGSEANGQTDNAVEAKSSLLPNTCIFKLHGSMTLGHRQSSLRQFSSNLPESKSAILLCTSVASRGLDLPLVNVVVQYDLPTESGHTEYIHRVGRTARAGHGGEAWSFVAPSELGWVEWLTKKIEPHATKLDHLLQPVDHVTVLREGLGGKGEDYQRRATQAQLAFEQCVLKVHMVGDLARNAFASHIRAYATHPIEEKFMFHIKLLHLGHLAKAFALRDAPASVPRLKQHTSKDLSKRHGRVRKLNPRKGANSSTNNASEFQIGSADLRHNAKL